MRNANLQHTQMPIHRICTSYEGLGTDWTEKFTHFYFLRRVTEFSSHVGSIDSLPNEFSSLYLQIQIRLQIHLIKRKHEVTVYQLVCKIFILIHFQKNYGVVIQVLIASEALNIKRFFQIMFPFDTNFFFFFWRQTACQSRKSAYSILQDSDFLNSELCYFLPER